MGRNFKRRPPTREPKRKILIICEGKETEFNYFNSIRQDMRLPTLQIIIEHPNKTDPRSIVQAAINRRDEIKHDRNQSGLTMIWFGRFLTVTSINSQIQIIGMMQYKKLKATKYI